MQTSDVMTRAVITVKPATELREVVDILLKHRISGVPVVENEGVQGFVGVGDLLHRHELGTESTADERNWWQRLLQIDPRPLAYVQSHGVHARDVMDRNVVSVAEDAPLNRLATIFEARHIRRVPVIRDGRMVGLVTRADLVRALARMCAPAAAPSRPLEDAEIRARLLAELAKQPWWVGTWSSVVVNQGVVRFIGFVQGESQKEAARIAAENIPGVRGVEDERGVESELQTIF